ncbi:MAG: indole-3-glycerol phosphate synthase TrpC [Thermodesulfobacteriota bacterium]
MTILDKILQNKKEEVRRLHELGCTDRLEARTLGLPPCRDLVASLKACPHVPIIAEIKRASPSMGKLRDVGDVGQLALSYQAAGAAGISVLTDRTFFGGSLEDLCQVRRSVDLPVLRKDFIIDAVQLCEARLSGADAALLIAAALSRSELRELYAQAVALGLTPLIEVHSEQEALQVLELEPTIIGINNRDLATLKVDLDICVKIRSVIPPEVTVVGESGINSPEDIRRLRDAGIDAFLVGTALMKADDPGERLRELGGR